MIAEILSWTQSAALFVWNSLFVTDSGHRLYWFYLLTFSAIASVIYLLRKPTEQSLIQFIFPFKLLLSQSSLTDVKIYFINGAIACGINLTALILSTVAIAEAVQGLLASMNDGNTLALTANRTVHAGFSVAFLLMTDFAIFFSHYLHHKIPLLWNIHKTHHSAKVLTPVTAFRFHPLEVILNGLVLSLLVGPIVGVYQFVYDPSFFKNNPTLFGIAMLLWLITANFRHSHIPLHYPEFISRWLVSPAMHNIHHSRKPKHFDKNFGLLFSFWDRFAGTYFLPEKHEELTFGLGEHEKFDFATDCYLTPIKQCSHLLKLSYIRFSRRKSV